tara:strand:- start:278 stop:403 length:126 start_codon:yes stop_codon:yes gene_type:complete
MVTISSFEDKYLVLHDYVVIKTFDTIYQAQTFAAEYRQGIE